MVLAVYLTVFRFYLTVSPSYLTNPLFNGLTPDQKLNGRSPPGRTAMGGAVPRPVLANMGLLAGSGLHTGFLFLSYDFGSLSYGFEILSYGLKGLSYGFAFLSNESVFQRPHSW